MSKVPEVTLIFWIIKILATTFGETGGDAVTMSWLGETTFSQTLGTALGDWVADTNEMGYIGAAAVLAVCSCSPRSFTISRASRAPCCFGRHSF